VCVCGQYFHFCFCSVFFLICFCLRFLSGYCGTALRNAHAPYCHLFCQTGSTIFFHVVS
jgi:hypothetical protein